MSKTFNITCRVHSADFTIFESVISQGIDSHLEGFTRSMFEIKDNRLFMYFDYSELPVLVRRLTELENDLALQWVEDIRAHAPIDGKFH